MFWFQIRSFQCKFVPEQGANINTGAKMGTETAVVIADSSDHVPSQKIKGTRGVEHPCKRLSVELRWIFWFTRIVTRQRGGPKAVSQVAWQAQRGTGGHMLVSPTKNGPFWRPKTWIKSAMVSCPDCSENTVIEQMRSLWEIVEPKQRTERES